MTHPPDTGKMVCRHDPDPDQVRDYGTHKTTRCLRCDARLLRSGFGPWRDAL